MQTIHFMEQSNTITYRIGRCAGKQEPCPSVGNQAEVEKSAIETNSCNNALEDHLAEESTHQGSQSATPQTSQRATLIKWSNEEYKDVMEAYLRALANPKISTTIYTYTICREKHPTLR